MIIAHISDIHLRNFAGVMPWAFAGQRVLGALNLLLNRAREFPETVAQTLFSDLVQLNPDHLIVSGDLSNLALSGEFSLALQRLESLGLPESSITVVPGNHDVYTYPSGWSGAFEKRFACYLKSDLVVAHAHRRGAFPLVRLRDGVAVVALSSAVPSPPLMATGRVGRRQLKGVAELLSHPAVKSRFRVVVIHHAIALNAGRRWGRLTDADAVRDVLRRCGADLVLHGHFHREMHEVISRGDERPISVIGVNSGTWLSHDVKRRASYNVYTIEDNRLTETHVRRYVGDGTIGGEFKQEVLRFR